MHNTTTDANPKAKRSFLLSCRDIKYISKILFESAMTNHARLEFECTSCDFVLRLNNARYEFNHNELAILIYPSENGNPLVMNVKRELDNHCPHCEGTLALRNAYYL